MILRKQPIAGLALALFVAASLPAQAGILHAKKKKDDDLMTSRKPSAAQNALIDKAIEAQQSLALSEGPLRRALRESDLATIRRELEQDPSVVNTTDEGGNTPLHLAARRLCQTYLILGFPACFVGKGRGVDRDDLPRGGAQTGSGSIGAGDDCQD